MLQSCIEVGNRTTVGNGENGGAESEKERGGWGEIGLIAAVSGGDVGEVQRVRKSNFIHG